MLSQNMIQEFVDTLVVFAGHYLIPIMLGVFATAAVLRLLIYFTVKREDWFAREFEKRVHQYPGDSEDNSFFAITKSILEKTYYELFEVRAIRKRRKPDAIMDWSDRVFLIQPGCAFLVRDTLKQIKYLKSQGQSPKLKEISKNVFLNNPCFNRVFGIIPTGLFNDLLNILPGIFIIGGILGTFLGIMKALPAIGGIDMASVESSKVVMDQFLVKISFSMSTSIIGIILSVLMTMVNTALTPEKVFVDIVDRYENALDMLWNRSDNNKVGENTNFDEHRDSFDALSSHSTDSSPAAAPKMDSSRGLALAELDDDDEYEYVDVDDDEWDAEGDYVYLDDEEEFDKTA